MIIASSHDPLDALRCFFRYLCADGRFAVFSEDCEPLAVAHAALKKSGMVCCLELTQTFFRDWTVLPGRTHPEMDMRGGGGWILSGVRVVPTELFLAERVRLGEGDAGAAEATLKGMRREIVGSES